MVRKITNQMLNELQAMRKGNRVEVLKKGASNAIRDIKKKVVGSRVGKWVKGKLDKRAAKKAGRATAKRIVSTTGRKSTYAKETHINNRAAKNAGGTYDAHSELANRDAKAASYISNKPSKQEKKRQGDYNEVPSSYFDYS
tara:strand:+ start:50 stop:472 length:423 start_codon:yes stop_codon:yes gene_type:complete